MGQESEALQEQHSESLASGSWDLPEQELNVSEMDRLVSDYREKRSIYEAKKKESAEAYHTLEEAENLVRSSLLGAGKSKYFVDGIGTVSLVQKSSFQTPKTAEEKLKLFEYIRQAHGEDTLIEFQSIHSTSLNSFANKELENNPTLQIPGLATPTVTTELRFRKES